MEKFFSYQMDILNSKGQSVVEYVLLLAVIASLSMIVFKNPRFKEFVKGDQGFFLSIRNGMAYSYRYGRDISTAKDAGQAMSFDYQNNQHDTYLNQSEGVSRFFSGTDAYPKN